MPPSHTFAIDHVVLLVRDLEAASQTMREAGFAVAKRADKAEKPGSTFRFVSFADGSYILLNAFSEEAMKAHRLGPVLREREGWGDWSILVPDMDAARTRASGAGIVLGSENKVANVLATGEPWGLRLLVCGRGSGGDESLPFLVQDVEGRDARIPACGPHPCGAGGIAGLTIASHTPLESAARLALLLGLPEPPGPVMTIGAQTVRFIPTDPHAQGTARLGGLVGVRLSGPAGAIDIDQWPHHWPHQSPMSGRRTSSIAAQ